ncbi:MAG: response regulator [Desulfatirhabdiaceae bacterium]
MKVLIAEDDLTSRTILKAILAKWGYDVEVTADGKSALSTMLKPDAPQLAVLDWMMPEMDGPAVCQELRKQQRQEPVYLILLTSKDDQQDIVHGLEAGADDYISKPYDTEELRARLYVGKRMITLQNELREREKLQGVLEMAGAVCHELNQPLQSLSGYSELLLMDMNENDIRYQTLKKMKLQVDRVGELTRKIMKITRYQSKPYLSKSRIIDIECASQT